MGRGKWSATGGILTLRGQIVDSKRFLGLMKPGNLEPHRARAVRFTSSASLPVSRVPGERGEAQHFLLTDTTGGSGKVRRPVVEPLEITSRVLRYDKLSVPRADPAAFCRSHD